MIGLTGEEAIVDRVWRLARVHSVEHEGDRLTVASVDVKCACVVDSSSDTLSATRWVAVCVAEE